MGLGKLSRGFSQKKKSQTLPWEPSTAYSSSIMGGVYVPFPHPYWNVGWCGLVWANILSAVHECSIVPQILKESLKLYRRHRLTLFSKSRLVLSIKTENNMVKYGSSSHFFFSTR